MTSVQDRHEGVWKEAGMFTLEGLDHIALRVRDVERSVNWYRETLGLERRHAEAWGNHPAIVCAGTTCLALFPAKTTEPVTHSDSGQRGMSHFAFRVDRHSFDIAQRVFQESGISFEFQDHAIAHSIYFHDPDGYEVELTTYDVPS